MQIAVRTRGYKHDYEWIGIGAFQSIGATLNDSMPGFVIRKSNDGQCDILIGCINRQGQTDYQDRQISMQVFIGGITEQQARSIAVAVLLDWNVTAPFSNTVSKIPYAKDKNREWDVDWEALEQLVKSLMGQPLSSQSISEAWEGDYNTRKQELLQTLKNCVLSAGAGRKIYWGGSPNTSEIYEQLQNEADRLYWKGGERKDLLPLRQQEKGESEVSKKVMWGMMAVIALLTLTTALALLKNHTLKKDYNSLQNKYQLLEQDFRNLENSLKNSESQHNQPIENLDKDRDAKEEETRSNTPMTSEILTPQGHPSDKE